MLVTRTVKEWTPGVYATTYSHANLPVEIFSTDYAGASFFLAKCVVVDTANLNIDIPVEVLEPLLYAVRSGKPLDVRGARDGNTIKVIVDHYKEFTRVFFQASGATTANTCSSEIVLNPEQRDGLVELLEAVVSDHPEDTEGVRSK